MSFDEVIVKNLLFCEFIFIIRYIVVLLQYIIIQSHFAFNPFIHQYNVKGNQNWLLSHASRAFTMVH